MREMIEGTPSAFVGRPDAREVDLWLDPTGAPTAKPYFEYRRQPKLYVGGRPGASLGRFVPKPVIGFSSTSQRPIFPIPGVVGDVIQRLRWQNPQAEPAYQRGQASRRRERRQTLSAFVRAAQDSATAGGGEYGVRV